MSIFSALNYLLPGIAIGIVFVGAAICLEALWQDRQRQAKKRVQEGEWE